MVVITALSRNEFGRWKKALVPRQLDKVQNSQGYWKPEKYGNLTSELLSWTLSFPVKIPFRYDPDHVGADFRAGRRVSMMLRALAKEQLW